MVCWCVAPVVALLYVLFDVNYFLRVAWTIGLARLFQKKVRVTDTTTTYGLCTTNDIDIFLRHMNNARYVRELDFARFHFYDRCGIIAAVQQRKGVPLQSASNIRYRRTIPIFTPYKVTTKMVYWDDKAIYIEQQFVTTSDDFVRAVALSKQIMVGVNVLELMSCLGGEEVVRPPIPQDLDHWLKANDLSSAKLKKTD